MNVKKMSHITHCVNVTCDINFLVGTVHNLFFLTRHIMSSRVCDVGGHSFFLVIIMVGGSMQLQEDEQLLRSTTFYH